MRDLHVIDVSATLHGGIRGHFGDNNSHGFPTGGIFNTLKILNKKTIDVHQDRFVFCFDRTTRVSTDSEGNRVGYKQGRKKWTKGMYYQAKLLEEMLMKMGFPVVYQTDREADECIYNVVKRYIKDFRHVYIYGTDRDLACCVTPKSSLASTNSNVPDVTYQNYTSVLGGTDYIPYNAILLYKIFRMDTSDKLGVIVTPREWEKLIQDLKEANFPLHQLNTAKALQFVIQNYNCTEEMKQKLWERYELVMPRDVNVDIDFTKPYNLDIMEKYCSLLSIAQFPKKFGVQITGTIHRDWYDSLLSLTEEINEELRELSIENPKIKIAKPYSYKGFNIDETPLGYTFFETYWR